MTARICKPCGGEVSSLAQQRGEYGPDLACRTFDLGNRVMAVLGPADKNGQRGLFESGYLAEELIGTVNELIEFVIAEGHVPTRIQLLNEQVTDLRNIIQEEIRAALKEQLARATPLMMRHEDHDASDTAISSSESTYSFAKGVQGF